MHRFIHSLPSNSLDQREGVLQAKIHSYHATPTQTLSKEKEVSNLDEEGLNDISNALRLSLGTVLEGLVTARTLKHCNRIAGRVILDLDMSFFRNFT